MKGLREEGYLVGTPRVLVSITPLPAPRSKKGGEGEKKKYSEKTYSSGPFVVLNIHRESNSLSQRLLPLDETRREGECGRTWAKGNE